MSQTFAYFVDILKYSAGLRVCDYKFYLVPVSKNKYINTGIYKYRNIFLWDTVTHLYSGLHEVESEGQGFPHEHVRVVTVLEGPFQLLQLPPREIGPGPTSLGGRALAVLVARIYKEHKKIIIYLNVNPLLIILLIRNCGKCLRTNLLNFYYAT